MKTTGDKILNKTLDKIGGKGLFVKELDMALRDGRADITVHSLKDMPAEIPEDLPLIAFSKRANPFDVLVLPDGESEIDYSKPIGCASSRRAIQLAEIYPGAEIKPVRGNVQTRLKKLDSGEYSALVLAAAGLERLGLENRISRRFTAEEMIPSAGQGIIAVQCKKENGFEFLADITDKSSLIVATAERAFIKKLDGGCTSPSAAYCTVEGDRIHLIGMNEIDGKMKKAEIWAGKDEAEIAGIRLAERLTV
jgi:hydroxymethylbilane synthase